MPISPRAGPPVPHADSRLSSGSEIYEENEEDSSRPSGLSFPVLTVSVLIGTGICFANVYFGLQAGIVNAMPMPAALVGFAFFKTLGKRSNTPFSTIDNTVLQVVAGALGSMPFTSGYTGLIPALEFLSTPSENGPVKFTVFQLLVWSLGICFLGTVVAAPLRWFFILREKLRFPSATATGVLIGVLHKDEDIAKRAKDIEIPTVREAAESEHDLEEIIDLVAREETPAIEVPDEAIMGEDLGNLGVRVLSRSFIFSSMFVSGP